MKYLAALLVISVSMQALAKGDLCKFALQPENAYSLLNGLIKDGFESSKVESQATSVSLKKEDKYDSDFKRRKVSGKFLIDPQILEIGGIDQIDLPNVIDLNKIANNKTKISKYHIGGGRSWEPLDIVTTLEAKKNRLKFTRETTVVRRSPVAIRDVVNLYGVRVADKFVVTRIKVKTKKDGKFTDNYSVDLANPVELQVK